MRNAAPRENQDKAAGGEEALVWSNLARQVSDPDTPANKIVQAIRPAYGISWNLAGALHVETDLMNPVFCLPRSSRLPRSEYGRLAEFLKLACSASGVIPPSSSYGEP